MKKLKKNVLNGIEDIRKERKMTKESEKKIKNRIIANGAIGMAIMVLVVIFFVISKSQEKVLSVFEDK